MKKTKILASVLLSACIALFSVCPVFAEEIITDDEFDYGYVVDDSHRLESKITEEKTKEEMHKEISQTYEYWTNVGFFRPYSFESSNEICSVVYEYEEMALSLASDYTYDEIKTAYDKLMLASDELLIYQPILDTAAQNCVNEQNYHNWYSDEHWAEYEKCRDAYLLAYEGDDGKVLRERYFELNYIYNKMTNEYMVMGDVNKDSILDVNDVTLIQLYLVGSYDFTGGQCRVAATWSDYYEDITVDSVTDWQMKIAGAKDDVYCYFIGESDYKMAVNAMLCGRYYHVQ